jgi:hypothetical protein
MLRFRQPHTIVMLTHLLSASFAQQRLLFFIAGPLGLMWDNIADKKIHIFLWNN